LKLNIGCGKIAIPDFLGVDRVKSPSVDIVWDLFKTPWPFEDESVDEVYAGHIVEHFHEPSQPVLEIHRILKTGGRVTIRVPYGLAGLYDPFHYHAFNERSFEYFCHPSDISLQGRLLFRIEEMYVSSLDLPYVYHAKKYVPRLLKFLPQNTELGYDGRLRLKLAMPGKRELTVKMVKV
jgi:SAM-dependent methyltransferase